MNFTDFLLPMLFIGIIGVVGITFWLAWIFFRARHKDKLEAPSLPVVPPFVAAEPEEAPVLKLTHAPSGEWEIAVHGQRYPTLESVPDDAVRQEVVAGLRELVAFARSYVQKTQTAGKRTPTASPQQKKSEPPAPSSAAPPVSKPPAPPDVDKARVFLKGEPVLKRPDAAPVLMPTLDLAREIGEIVSEMQARIPSLIGRSVRLQNAPGGGVQFAIDGIVYPDVNSIPDLDIQALIRAATQEWERR